MVEVVLVVEPRMDQCFELHLALVSLLLWVESLAKRHLLMRAEIDQSTVDYFCFHSHKT